jgi:hypothetical protein
MQMTDLLTETLLALSEEDAKAGGVVDRARLFRFVQEGVEHFVHWLDPLSFYGLVPATITAYILKAAKVCEGGSCLCVSTIARASCLRVRVRLSGLVRGCVLG